jgi:hypothetical protein
MTVNSSSQRSARRLCGALLLALTLPAVAGAEDKVRARRLYDEGEAEYKAGHFLEAARRFEQAHAELPRHALLWNIGQAYRHQFDIDRDPERLIRARDAFKGFAQKAQSPVDVREAQDAAAEVDRRLAAFEAAQAARDAVAGAVPAPSPASPWPRDQGSRLTLVTSLSLIAGGVVTGAGGMALGLLAHGEAQTVQASSTPAAPVPFGSVADHQSRGQALANASYVFYGVGAAAVLAGAAVAVLHPRFGARPTLGLWLAPAPGGAVAGGVF